MVTVIQKQPSFAQNFFEGMGQTASSNLQRQLQQMEQMKVQKQQQSQLSDALGKANQIWNSPLPDEQKILGLHQALSGLDPTIARTVVDQLQSSQQQQQKKQQDVIENQRQIEAETLKHQRALELQQLKNEGKKKPEDDQKLAKESLQTAFDSMSSLLKNNTSGIGISPFTALGLDRQGVEARNMFDTLRAKYEMTLLPLVNKGTLARERFNYIMSLIPKADESQRAIAGKLRGLALELGLDEKILDEIPWVSESLKSIGKKPESKEPEAKPGFVKMKDPQGIERWVPEDVAKQLQGG